jgi:tape measure domain-containing protein
MGIQAEEASDVLLRLGDIAGGSGEALKSLGLNMGQVFAKGKADSTDLKQFVTQGFDVVGVVAQQTGKTREQVEKAGVTYEQTAAALRVLTNEGGKYYGLMQKNMNTIPGVIAQIKSFVAATQEAIGFGVSNEIKEMLKSILGIGRAMQETFVTTGIKVIKEILIGIAMVHVAFVRLSDRLSDAGGIFGNIKVLAQAFFGFLGSLIRSVLPVILSIAEILIRAFGPVKAFIVPVLEALKPVFADVFGKLNQLLEPLKPLITGLEGAFGRMGESVGRIITNIYNSIKKVLDFVIPIIPSALPGGIKKASGLLEGVINILEKISGFTGPILGVVAAIKGIGIAKNVVSGVQAGINTVNGITALWKGNLIQAGMTLRAGGFGQDAINSLAETFSVLRGKTDLATAAANKNRVAQIMLAAQTAKNRVATLALATAHKVQAAAAKVWDIAKYTALLAAQAVKTATLRVATLAQAAAQQIAAKASAAWNFAKMIAGMVASKAAMVAHTIATYAMAAATNVAAGATALLNAAFVATPIGWIVLGVLALVAAVILLVKNWDKVGPAIIGAFSAIGNFFVTIGKAIGQFFVWLWSKITGVFSAIVAFVKNNLVNIVNVVLTILFPIAGIVMAIVRLIIKHWDTIKGAFIKVAKAVVDGVKAAWEKIVSVAKGIWNRVVGVVQAVVNRIKAVWEGIVNAVAVIVTVVRLIIERVWNGIVAFVQTVIDGVKGAWQAFSDFMGGLWEGIKGVAGLVWEGIKNTFASSINFIHGLWDGFTGFFTGTWDKIKGAFSTAKDFFGFGDDEKEPQGSGGASGAPGGMVPAATAIRPVNDMILTPEGRFATDPADYIMAMKNPMDLAGRAAYNAASPVNNYSSSRQSVSINVTSQITAAVPAGTPAEQKAALQRQAREAVHSEWAQVIQGARGLIPSPEGRRAL